MGELGNFYCVPNSCSRITWRPYRSTAKKVRYRMPGETDWTEVEGDDWEFKDRHDLLTSFRIYADTTYTGNTNYFGTRTCGVPINLRSHELFGIPNSVVINSIYGLDRPGENYPVLAMDITFTGHDSNYQLQEGKTATIIFPDATNTTFKYSSSCLDYDGEIGFVNSVSPNLTNINYGINHCILTIKKDGLPTQSISSDTNTCPEVELINDNSTCELSETFNELTVEKFPFLERVEVVDYSYVYFGLNVFRGDIENHCLNVYKNNVAAIVPLPGGLPTPTNATENSTILVAQICSDSGCLPPEFEVSCDCDCRECPEGTCATECDGHICCNDIATGQLIESIPIAEYCEST